MKTPYTKSGRCGRLVYQLARYGQICYPAFVPFNPNTPAQAAIRNIFGAVSKRWRTLTPAQQALWNTVAATIMSKLRLFQCGPLTGFSLFVKVNVALAHRGLPQVDVPPPVPDRAQPAAPNLSCPAAFEQPPVGPTLFLRANLLLDALQDNPREFAAGVSPPTG